MINNEYSLEKIYKDKIVFSKSSLTPVKWKDVKEFQFEDEDIIESGYQEETYSSNGGESEHFYFTVTRKVIETEKEYQGRQENIRIEKEEMRKRRYQTYLKYKDEFEKDK